MARILRRHPETLAILATRVFLLALVIVVHRPRRQELARHSHPRRDRRRWDSRAAGHGIRSRPEPHVCPATRADQRASQTPQR